MNKIPSISPPKELSQPLLSVFFFSLELRKFFLRQNWFSFTRITVLKGALFSLFSPERKGFGRFFSLSCSETGRTFFFPFSRQSALFSRIKFLLSLLFSPFSFLWKTLFFFFLRRYEKKCPPLPFKIRVLSSKIPLSSFSTPPFHSAGSDS